MTTKKCTKCEADKPLSEFYRMNASPDGLAYVCKSCGNAAKTAHRKANPDLFRRRARKSYRKHRDWYLANQIEYRKKNREKTKAQGAAKWLPLAEFCITCHATESLERHHPDYTKPKEIVTLCRRCHKAIHTAAAGAKFPAAI